MISPVGAPGRAGCPGRAALYAVPNTVEVRSSFNFAVGTSPGGVGVLQKPPPTSGLPKRSALFPLIALRNSASSDAFRKQTQSEKGAGCVHGAKRMNRITTSLAAIVGAFVLAPTAALAAPAVTTAPTTLRAGPAFDFPVVDEIPSEARVNVHGCVRGYRWCDISWRDARGWVSSDELAYLYGGRRVTFVEYGPRIGLPVLVFSFDSYWDRHYRSRSWYGERARYRTVWGDRGRDGPRNSDRSKDRRDNDGRKVDQRSRDNARHDADDRKGSKMDRRSDRGTKDERPSDRTGGTKLREGETRGYLPSDRGQGQRKHSGSSGADQSGSDGRGRPSGSGPERGGDRDGQGEGHRR